MRKYTILAVTVLAVFGLTACDDDSTEPSTDAPVAAFSFTCDAQVCDFTDESTDPDGTVTAWAWDFDDGESATSADPTHTFDAAGTYNVTLTVTDDDGLTDDVTQSVEVEDEIVGTWVSKGADLAPGFAAFAVDSIYATFNADQTYVVDQYAGGSDQPVVLTGTYVTGDQPAGEIRSITLTQATPSGLTAEGIFQVSGDAMQYEVIQTSPDIGATAPTVAGGFGSTVVAGTETTVWIQNYDRVDM